MLLKKWKYVVIILFPIIPSKSYAEIRICNEGRDMTFGVSYVENGIQVTQGWMHVVHGQCGVLVPGHHNNRYFYVAGISDHEIFPARGLRATLICAKKVSFRILEDPARKSCPPGYGFIRSGEFASDTEVMTIHVAPPPN